ncbi:SWIM zinc finger family protein [uncultured Erythrobacter sp.]|uniref:SWIM zinc finger family protein n=2 Tax=uncultured Erythrobacter sp. TaxID=263913 RepID=UPI00261B7CF8|nr:SWIM zinc finger family protein [uncultured Erythrobacter sp.]
MGFRRAEATGVHLALSLNKIERMAPDQASLTAAKKLIKPAKWPLLQEDGDGLIWGECQGSGSTPYRVAVSESDAGYKCTCPSRKFPCKHAIALMWLRADALAPFAAGTPPQWVNDWLSRRRDPAKGQTNDGKPPDKSKEGPHPSISATALEKEPDPASPEAIAKAEAQKARNRAKREKLIEGGIEAMEQWIEDQLERGLTGFDQRAVNDCDVLAKRLVDAKAGGLANRVSALPPLLFQIDEQHRPIRAARELSALYLIGQAYTRQSKLSDALKEDVRQAVGWAMTREALLAEKDHRRADGDWRVLATSDEVQADRLRRIETWLESTSEDRRKALLLDFVPVSSGASGTVFEPGEILNAELVFYPSPVPLRAQIADHRGTRTADGTWDGASASLPDGLAEWRKALAQKPWLDGFPIATNDVELRSSNGKLFVCSNDTALPIAPGFEAQAFPLTEVGKISLFGFWDGYEFEPSLAATSLGEWSVS